MQDGPGADKQPASKKELLQGLAGGCGMLLFIAAIVAGAVLLRASWYFE